MHRPLVKSASIPDVATSASTKFMDLAVPPANVVIKVTTFLIGVIDPGGLLPSTSTGTLYKCGCEIPNGQLFITTLAKVFHQS